MRSEGVEFDILDYLKNPLSEDALLDLIRDLDEDAGSLLRQSSPTAEALSDEEVVRRLISDPSLMQRPIVRKGSRALIARPPERWRELL